VIARAPMTRRAPLNCAALAALMVPDGAFRTEPGATGAAIGFFERRPKRPVTQASATTPQDRRRRQGDPSLERPVGRSAAPDSVTYRPFWPLRALLMVSVKPIRAANGGVFQPECGGQGGPPKHVIAGREPPKHVIARAPIRRAPLNCASLAALMVPDGAFRTEPGATGAAIGFFERRPKRPVTQAHHVPPFALLAEAPGSIMSFALGTILRFTLILLITSLVPLHGQADLLLGSIKEDFLSRRFSEAEAKLRQLLEKEPGDVSAAYLLVRTLIEDNRPEEALVVAESAREQCSSCPLVHVAVGDAKYRKGEFQAASASYQEATQLNRREARALLGLGLILTSEFQFKAARRHLREALELDPDDPDIADALASTLAHGPEKIALQQRYAALATYRDPLELAAQRARLELLRSREAKPPLSLSRAPEEMVLPLVSVRNRAHAPPIAVLLPVSINGREPRNLLVDSGAHGLLISSRYAREDSV
jgi:Flp pilus assembly protein TadD